MHHFWALWTVFLLALCMLTRTAGSPTHADYVQIHEFLDAMQTPQNCTGVDYVWSDMGCGGGFAAHFQLAAALWMRAASITGYKMPVLIIGSIWKYSEGRECKHVGGDWTCFFLPVSGCQTELKKTGKQVAVDFKKLTTFTEDLLPPQFRHVGIAYWWGLVQERMFRLQPAVRQYIHREASRLNGGQGFPGVTLEALEPGWLQRNAGSYRGGSAPIAGVHVRHGDKHTDGFLHHSMAAELRAVHASPQCGTADSAFIADAAGAQKQKVCWVQDAADQLRKLPIFVASDDAAVLAKAAEMGHLVDSQGVSQSTHSAGMLTTLLHKPEMGYNASLEIIRDVFLLSRCSTLVGIAASQIFRMAVGISNATGTLVVATAMDHAQIPRVAQMSAKYHLPLVEHFALPPPPPPPAENDENGK